MRQGRERKREVTGNKRCGEGPETRGERVRQGRGGTIARGGNGSGKGRERTTGTVTRRVGDPGAHPDSQLPQYTVPYSPVARTEGPAAPAVPESRPHPLCGFGGTRPGCPAPGGWAGLRIYLGMRGREVGGGCEMKEVAPIEKRTRSNAACQRLRS